MPNIQAKSARGVSFLFLACAIFYASNSHSTSEGSNSLPLDVVLVMDSSGSMKRTDPQDLRKPAAKLFISLLDDKDRASVVSFSDKGYPVAFFTPVKGKQNEEKLFAAVDRISNKGVYTNLLGAVEGAMRVINRNPLPNRKQIIVLMTDGKMDLGNDTNNNANSEKLFNELVPQLKKQNIELHTIAFTDESDKAYLEKIALGTGGKFNLAQNNKQLHDVYTAIFEQNKQPNMLPFNGEKFTVDSAIKEVTIVGSKETEDVVLSLQNPNGEIYTAKNKPEAMKWFTAQAFDLITITNPKAGEWQIKASNGKNKAYVITDLKFQLQVEPQEVAIGEGLMINAWLEDKGERINKPSVLSNLTMELRVHTPEGETHVLDMQPQTSDGAGAELSGVYMSHIALPADGRYQIEVVANGSTFSRARNSLVNVFDPAKQQQPVAETPITEAHTSPSIEPAMPVIGPAIDPPIAAAHIESKTEPPTSAEEPITDHAQSQEIAHPEEPPLKQESPPIEDLTAAVTDHKSEKPAKTKLHNETKQEPAADAKEDHGPNLVKALVIFLIINSVFALIGGIAYFIYRMKKKKAAKSGDKDGEEKIDDEEDAKKAA